jgi:general secretion pathway protein D
MQRLGKAFLLMTGFLLLQSHALGDERVVLGAFHVKANASAYSQQIAKLTHQTPLIKQTQSSKNPLYVVEYKRLTEGKASQLKQQLASQHIDTLTHYLPSLDAPAPVNQAKTNVNPKPKTTAKAPKIALKQLAQIDHLMMPRKAQSNHSQHSTPKTIKPLLKLHPPQTAPKTRAIKQSPASHHLHPKRHTRLWNLRNVDVRAVIAEVSRETGKNFIIDPRVQGKMTIVSSTPITADAVYPLFLSALQTLGYAAIPSGQQIKIVPNVDAKSLATRVVGQHSYAHGDESVVRVVPVKYVSAEQLVPTLRPLLPQWGNISAYRPSNSLVIAGRAANVKRLTRIIKQVDTPSHNRISVVRLRNALADEVLKTLKSLVSKTTTDINQPVITADSRSNAIVIEGSRAQRLRMQVLIAQLDARNPNGMGGNTRIIPLRYLSAKDLAPILAGIARARFGGTVGVVIGSRSTENQLQFTKNDNPTASDVVNPRSPTPAPNIQPSVGSAQANGAAQSTAGSKPRVEIIAEPNSNSIILNAPPTLMRTLQQVVRRLDVRPQQVQVQAIIANVDEGDISRLGIQWGTVGLAQNEKGGLSPGFNQGLGVITEDGIRTFQARIHALASRDRANILSTPSVVVLNNHQAQISIGTQVSAKESEYPGNGSSAGANPFTTFTRLNANLHLYVKPQINGGRSIELSINHGDDELEDGTRNTENPIINTSSIKTTVLINSGDILVLGGLIQNKVQENRNKVPILGDIPVVGELFKERKRSGDRKKLMVFIRPIILHDPLAGTQITKPLYNQLREEQLHWMRKLPYSPTHQQAALPPFNRAARLPVPFQPAK